MAYFGLPSLLIHLHFELPSLHPPCKHIHYTKPRSGHSIGLDRPTTGWEPTATSSRRTPQKISFSIFFHVCIILGGSFTGLNRLK